MKFSCDAIGAFAKRAFMHVGVPEEDAAQAAAVIAQAERSGVNSHGLQRLPMYMNRLLDGAVNMHPDLKMTSLVPGCMAFDGDNGLGIVNGPRVLDIVIERAKELGIAAATLNHSNHYGAGNYYGWKLAKAGLIGICMTNTSPCMAPTGGSESLLGSNPLTVAFPARNHDPVVLDMATSTVSLGKLQVMAGAGKEAPLGWVLDSEGKPSTDPAAPLKGGSMVPVGGYKGYGLALIIDLFSAVLSGACYGWDIGRLGVPGSKQPEGIGHFFLAVDPARFLPEEAYYQRMEDYIDMIKNSRLAPGVAQIWMPGEIEFNNARRIEAEGAEVPPATAQRVVQCCIRCGMAAEGATLEELIRGDV